MKQLIRIVVGVGLLGAALVYHPLPATADHGVGATELPCVDDTGTAGSDCWHEDQPDFAKAVAEDLCFVTGTVDPGASFNNDAHTPSIPLVNDDPSHSHFAFIDSIINCPGSNGALTVTAEGGNDGHMIDLFGPNNPDGTPLELDLDSQESLNICSTVHPNLCVNGPKTDPDKQHEGNKHHGSVNESGWSHSSLYSGGPGGGESNACVSSQNNNKADIVVNGLPGWVKYVRVGTAVYAWGCVPGLAPLHHFSTALSILPNVLPVNVPNPLPFPGNVLNPLCPLEFLNDPPFNVGGPMQPCGFVLGGLAWRGPAWA